MHERWSDVSHGYFAETTELAISKLLCPSAQETTFLAPPGARKRKTIPKGQQPYYELLRSVGLATVVPDSSIHISVHKVKAS